MRLRLNMFPSRPDADRHGLMMALPSCRAAEQPYTWPHVCQPHFGDVCVQRVCACVCVSVYVVTGCYCLAFAHKHTFARWASERAWLTHDEHQRENGSTCTNCNRITPPHTLTHTMGATTRALVRLYAHNRRQTTAPQQPAPYRQPSSHLIPAPGGTHMCVGCSWCRRNYCVVAALDGALLEPVFGLKIQFKFLLDSKCLVVGSR